MNEKTIWKLRKLIDRRKQVWRETLPPLAGVGVGGWSVQALELCSPRSQTHLFPGGNLRGSLFLAMP